MKKTFLLLLMALVLPMGCAQTSKNVKESSAGVRSDVFHEPGKGTEAGKGFTDLRISATLKTHRPHIYSATDSHGTPGYKLLLSIDGQQLELLGEPQKEVVEPSGVADPEAGSGVRYVFAEIIRLKEGSHKLTVMLPEDGVTVHREIVVTAGKVNRLVLEPVYRGEAGMKRKDPYTATSFEEGIRSLRVTLNGEEIRNGAQ